MKVFFCTALLVGSAIAASIGPFRPRIIDGNEAAPHEFPYMVSLQYLNDQVKHFCGGSILTEKWVLTAAHCVDKYNNDSEVVAGAHSISNPDEFEQRRTPLRIIIHEGYAGKVKPHDLALIEVSEPFVFNKNVNSIPLTTKDHEYPSGHVTMSGWGLTITENTTGYTTPDKLMKLDFPILDAKTCHTNFSEPGMHETNFCAGKLEDSKSACMGDSGSPLVQKNSEGKLELLGVTSWTWTPCGTIGKTTVFTNLSHYLKWISEKMNS